jgi:hypothetical protein
VTAVLPAPTTMAMPVSPQWVAATVNGDPVRVQAANSPASGAAGVASVSVALALPFEDLVAALFVWDGDPDDDFADAAYCRQLVVEVVLGLGLVELHAVKAEMADAELGTPAGAWLAYCQRRALELLGLPTAPVPNPSTDPPPSRPSVASGRRPAGPVVVTFDDEMRA